MKKSGIPVLKYFGVVREFTNLKSYINIADNNIVTVENCKQIVQCTEIMVKLITGPFIVEIWGNGLRLSNYSENCVEVRGIIEQVKLVSKTIGVRS